MGTRIESSGRAAWTQAAGPPPRASLPSGKATRLPGTTHAPLSGVKMGLEGGFIPETVTSAATGPQPESRPAHPSGEEGASSPGGKRLARENVLEEGAVLPDWPDSRQSPGSHGPGGGPFTAQCEFHAHSPCAPEHTARTHLHSPPGPFCRNGGRQGGGARVAGRVTMQTEKEEKGRSASAHLRRAVGSWHIHKPCTGEISNLTRPEPCARGGPPPSGDRDVCC